MNKNMIVGLSFASFLLSWLLGVPVQPAFTFSALSCIGHLWWYLPATEGNNNVTKESCQ